MKRAGKSVASGDEPDPSSTAFANDATPRDVPLHPNVEKWHKEHGFKSSSKRS